MAGELNDESEKLKGLTSLKKEEKIAKSFFLFFLSYPTSLTQTWMHLEHSKTFWPCHLLFAPSRVEHIKM